MDKKHPLFEYFKNQLELCYNKIKWSISERNEKNFNYWHGRHNSFAEMAMDMGVELNKIGRFPVQFPVTDAQFQYWDAQFAEV